MEEDNSNISVSSSRPSLGLFSEDYDLTNEDLSFLISPEPTGRSQLSNQSGSTNASVTSQSKISPLVTDEYQLDNNRPAMNSVRAYDANNNPIFSSSQTPHDFQVMTKRKVSKKSYFNFEGVDIASKPQGQQHSSFPADDTSDTSKSTPTESPASMGTNSSVPTINASYMMQPYQGVFVKQEPFTSDSLDERSFKVDLNDFSNMPQYLPNPGWNTAPNNNVEPTEGRNPRKKQLGGMNNDANYNGMEYYGNPSGYTSAPNGIPQQANVQYYVKDEPGLSQDNRWGGPNIQMDYPIQQNNMYPPPPQQEYLPSIKSMQATSQLYGQYPFDVNMTSNLYDYNQQSQVSYPPAGPRSNLPELSSNYHAILQQKVEAMKLNQSPNSTYENTSALPYNNVQQPYMPQQPNQSSYPSSSASVADTSTQDEDDGKDKGRGRASKSLAEISKRFVTLYGKDNTMDYISGLVDPDQVTDPPTVLNRVDGAAEALSVHVRRIYELIKILEILSLVAFAGDKRGKFSWRGTKDFLFTLGTIQNDGLESYPKLAAQSGLIDVQVDNEIKPDLFAGPAEDIGADEFNDPEWSDLNQLLTESSLFDLDNPNSAEFFKIGEDSSSSPPVGATATKAPTKSSTTSATASASKSSGAEEHFMVEIICKKFLQLFLVGMNLMSMSSAIQKLIPMEKSQTLSEYNKVNATKIRRVYDVTNVLCSLNLIKKKTIPRNKAIKAEQTNNIDDKSAILPSEQDDLFDEDGKASSGKKGAAKSGRGADRADTKVLEWSSFAPVIIRQKYLQRLKEKGGSGI